MRTDSRPAKSAVEGRESSCSKQRETLVAYFSWSGNTRKIAGHIHDVVGGDLFEIVSVDRYPSDYDECVSQARRELDAGYIPKLKSEAKNVDSYDVVIIGYPSWWGTVPRPVISFLSKYDLSGKTIAPFCTHEGSHLGRSVKDITKVCPQSIVLEGLAIRGDDVGSAEEEVCQWLRRIGVM